MSADPAYQRARRARLAIEAGRAPGVVGRPPSAPCGTVSAYKRHQRRGETPCEACRGAWSTYQRERYQARQNAKKAPRPLDPGANRGA